MAAAQLDLSSKLDAAALTRSNRQIIAQQEQLNNFSAFSQRQQLEITQKGRLQSAIADVGTTAPDTQGANINNTLFNAIVQQQSLDYYKEFSRNLVEQAKLNPVILPQFSSPYSGNYNAPGVASDSLRSGSPTIKANQDNPEKLAPPPSVLNRSGVGSLDFNVPAPKFSIEAFDKYQQDAKSRYQEFVANPVRIEVSPQVQQQVQNRTRERGNEVEAPVKPITVNLQMTNNVTNQVKDATETRETMTHGALQSIEDVVRLVQQKYN